MVRIDCTEGRKGDVRNKSAEILKQCQSKLNIEWSDITSQLVEIAEEVKADLF